MVARKHCIIYARVSTKDKKQDTKAQVNQLLKYAERNNLEVVEIIEEYESTKKSRKKLNQLITNFYDKEFSVVLIWSLDRLSRGGVYETLMILNRLTSRGIEVISYTEEWLNMSNEFIKPILIAVFSSLANLERRRIGERVKMGLEKAVADGKQLGRPQKQISKKRLESIKKMRKEGKGYGEIGKAVCLKREMVRLICNRYGFKKGL